MRPNRRLTFKRKLAYVAVISCFTVMPAFANPIGATVANGQVGFAVQGSTLTITNTPNAIINWQQFSIGPGEITRFMQQSASSAVLNRVLGQDPSQILGSLLSNGRVFLVNPNGIVFGQGAVIDVAGLVASTLRLSDGDFLAGRLNFTNGAGTGGIDNQGTITTPNGGNIYLIAPDIRNSGLITSPQGEILLAAGHTVNLMDAANPSVQVTLSAPDTQAVNIGALMAQSGKIGIYGTLINQRGMANADTAVLGANGRIMLRASKDITLEPGSLTTASGMAGGVRDGGEIRIVADGALNMRPGSGVHVDGGADGGSGGFLELSGKQKIIFGGVFTGSALKDGYRGGKLFIDPTDLEICTGMTCLVSGATTLDPALIDPDGAAGFNDITLTASRDIFVNTQIVNTHVAGGSAVGSLTMNAGNSINIAAAIGTSGSRFAHALTLQAGNNVNINASIYMGNRTLLVRSGASSGQLGFAPYACSPCGYSISITPPAANPVTVDVQGGIELYASAGGAVNITGGNAMNQDASVTVHGGTVTVNAGSVTIQGGTASASGDTVTPSADASASLLADGAMSVTTTPGGLTISGGKATANASCCSPGISVSATADATLSAGALTLTVANGLTVQGGSSIRAVASGSYIATANANAVIQVTGNLEITKGAGVRVAAVQISGGSAQASVSGTSGSGSAAAYANASVTAGSLTLRTDSLTVGGGAVRAQVGSSSAGAINRSATAESKALLQVNGSVAVMDIGSGGLTVSGGTGSGSGCPPVCTALVYGSGGTNSALADRSARINVTGDLASLTVTGGGITVQGGNAWASASGSGTNTATENANASITVTGAMTLNIGGGLSMANGGASASGLGATASAAASISAGATMTVSADAMDIAGSLISTGGLMTLMPLTAGYGIDLGTETAGQLSLTALELGRISAAQLMIGSSTAGAIAISDSFMRSEPLSLISGADITLNTGFTITSAATGDAVVLAAGGNFINNAGAGAISLTGAGSPRWLVYSTNPASNTFGGLDSGNTAIWNATYTGMPPASVTQTGKRYLFSFQPTLTFTSASASKTYGTDAAAALAGAYGVSGLNAGVANAYLADTNATVFSGAPSVASAGSPVSAVVSGSPYIVTIAQGSLGALNGYAFAFASSGLLTVDPPVGPTVLDNPDVTAALDFGNEETNDSANVDGFVPIISLVGEGDKEKEDEIPVCN